MVHEKPQLLRKMCGQVSLCGVVCGIFNGVVCGVVGLLLAAPVIAGTCQGATQQEATEGVPTPSSQPVEWGQYLIPLSALKWKDSYFAPDSHKRFAWRNQFQFPRAHGTFRVTLAGAGEGYFFIDQTNPRQQQPTPIRETIRQGLARSFPGNQIDDSLTSAEKGLTIENGLISVKIPKGGALKGWIEFPSSYATGDSGGYSRAEFFLPADQLVHDELLGFTAVKLTHYQRLAEGNFPGSSWWVYQRDQITQQLGSDFTRDLSRDPLNQNRNRSGSNVTSNYDLFSGGLAISENLQLALNLEDAAKIQPVDIPLKDVLGITIREFDWNALTEGIDPKLDRSATIIPADQHALVFSSGSALINGLHSIDQFGFPILSAAELSPESADWVPKYLGQMLLSLERLSGWEQNHQIQSATITGGDFYFSTGTDVLLILQSNNGDQILAELREAMDQQLTLLPQAQRSTANLGDFSVESLLTKNRDLSCFAMQMEDFILISNSLASIQQALEVRSGQQPSLASLDEYRFMRNRYPLGEERETCFLMISDATIRRWCSPAWRIGQKRRLHAAANMGRAIAANYSHVLAGNSDQFSQTNFIFAVPNLTSLSLNDGQILSQTYGTRKFLTPIRELNITQATRSEVDGYQQWRRVYEGRWSGVFDPIGMQIKIQPDSVTGDITVMPLIDRSGYDWIAMLLLDTKLQPSHSFSPDTAQVSFDMGLNVNGPLFNIIRMTLSNRENWGGNPFAWMGNWLSIYIDSADWFQQLESAEGAQDLLDGQLTVPPLVVAIDVKSVFGLAAFMLKAREYLDSMAPNLFNYETRQHQDVGYVRILPREGNGDLLLKDIEFGYSTGNPLLISLNEEALKRAMELREIRNAQLTDPQSEVAQPDAHAEQFDVFGESMNLRLNQLAIRAFLEVDQADRSRALREQAWRNLPILNEWKRLFPDKDPRVVHEQLFGDQLLVGDLQGYQWNEEWQTMESVTFGHPGQPRMKYLYPASLELIDRVEFGVTFELDGIRAKTRLSAKEEK